MVTTQEQPLQNTEPSIVDMLDNPDMVKEVVTNASETVRGNVKQQNIEQMVNEGAGRSAADVLGNISEDKLRQKDEVGDVTTKLSNMAATKSTRFMQENWQPLLVAMAGTALQMIAVHNDKPGLFLAGGMLSGTGMGLANRWLNDQDQIERSMVEGTIDKRTQTIRNSEFFEQANGLLEELQARANREGEDFDQKDKEEALARLRNLANQYPQILSVTEEEYAKRIQSVEPEPGARADIMKAGEMTRQLEEGHKVSERGLQTELRRIVEEDFDSIYGEMKGDPAKIREAIAKRLEVHAEMYDDKPRERAYEMAMSFKPEDVSDIWTSDVEQRMAFAPTKDVAQMAGFFGNADGIVDSTLQVDVSNPDYSPVIRDVRQGSTLREVSEEALKFIKSRAEFRPVEGKKNRYALYAPLLYLPHVKSVEESHPFLRGVSPLIRRMEARKYVYVKLFEEERPWLREPNTATKANAKRYYWDRFKEEGAAMMTQEAIDALSSIRPIALRVAK